MRTCVRATLSTILHADLDAFYASVEQRGATTPGCATGRSPVGGGGVILAASYEAKRSAA